MKKNTKKREKQPVHPGVLLEKFIKDHGLSVYQLSKEIKIDASLLGKIIKGTRPVSPLVSLTLGKFFNLDEAYWITLQVKYDLGVTKLEKEVLIHSLRTYKEYGNLK